MDCRSTLYSILNDDDFLSVNGDYVFPLGLKEGGTIVSWDMGLIPHILVAGTTGSGKTNFVKAALLSLCSTCSPDTLQIIIFNSKFVEYFPFASLPHLCAPVITDANKLEAVVSWLITESYRRMKQKATGNSSNLQHVLLVVDDYNDTVASPSLVKAFEQLLQVGRSANIHCIILSNAPSSKHFSGDFKASFPCRISFHVASKSISRMILDQNGAESLVYPGELIAKFQNALIKCMSIEITEEDETLFIRHILERSPSKSNSGLDDSLGELFNRKDDSKDSSSSGKDSEVHTDDIGFDELLPQAVNIIFETKQASVSMLQRRLKLGYSRCARIIDQLEEIGVIGPFEGSRPRQILITPTQWIEMQTIQSGVKNNSPFFSPDIPYSRPIKGFTLTLNHGRRIYTASNNVVFICPDFRLTSRSFIKCSIPSHLIVSLHLQMPTLLKDGVLTIEVPHDYSLGEKRAEITPFLDASGCFSYRFSKAEAKYMKQMADDLAKDLTVPITVL